MALQENHEAFPPETRASLIDDIFSLAAVGLMKYETVFDFIKYMQMEERNYLPWNALMRHVFKLNRLLYETSIFTDYQVSYGWKWNKTIVTIRWLQPNYVIFIGNIFMKF